MKNRLLNFDSLANGLNFGNRLFIYTYGGDLMSAKKQNKKIFFFRRKIKKELPKTLFLTSDLLGNLKSNQRGEFFI